MARPAGQRQPSRSWAGLRGAADANTASYTARRLDVHRHGRCRAQPRRHASGNQGIVELKPRTQTCVILSRIDIATVARAPRQGAAQWHSKSWCRRTAGVRRTGAEAVHAPRIVRRGLGLPGFPAYADGCRMPSDHHRPGTRRSTPRLGRPQAHGCGTLANLVDGRSGMKMPGLEQPVVSSTIDGRIDVDRHLFRRFRGPGVSTNAVRRMSTNKLHGRHHPSIGLSAAREYPMRAQQRQHLLVEFTRTNTYL